MTPEVSAALGSARVVLIAPSNPIVSVGPILAVPGIRDAHRRGACAGASRSWRSPGSSAGGRSRDRPIGCSCRSVTSRAPSGWPGCYAGLVDGFVVDTVDSELAPAIETLGIRTLVTDTVMTDDAARARLARETLDFAERTGSDA